MKVLCVDDEKANRQVIAGMLSVVGTAVVEAGSAEEALEVVGREQLDVILMDLRMPSIDGFEAIRRIRARADSKAAVPVIVVTGDTGLHIRPDCLAVGANEVLLKPVEMRKLFAAISAVLASRPARASLG